MMRILIVNSEYPPVGGGAGNASAHIAQQFAKLGHKVFVVTPRFGKLPPIDQNNGVIVYRIPSLRQKQDRSTALEQMIFLLSAAFWSLKMTLSLKPDVSLAFFGIPSGAITWVIKKIYKIPYVVSLRGGDVPGFRPYDFDLYHKLMAPLLRLIWKDASAIVANSNGLRSLALQFDSRFEIPVIPNGVEAEGCDNQNRDWTTPRLLFVGRLVHQKGLDLAMHALAEFRDMPWEWQIAGDGPQLGVLKSLAEKLQIHDRIVFSGWQTREQLLKQYGFSNLFLFPSRHEGMPNAMLEAMASGLPVIASRIAGNEELVADRETGFLFASENIEALRAALKELLSAAALRQKMGTASRQRVKEHYSWESTAKQYALLLEKVK